MEAGQREGGPHLQRRGDRPQWDLHSNVNNRHHETAVPPPRKLKCKQKNVITTPFTGARRRATGGPEPGLRGPRAPLRDPHLSAPGNMKTNAHPRIGYSGYLASEEWGPSAEISCLPSNVSHTHSSSIYYGKQGPNLDNFQGKQGPNLDNFPGRPTHLKNSKKKKSLTMEKIWRWRHMAK